MTLSYSEIGYGGTPYGSLSYGAIIRSAQQGAQFEVLRAVIPEGSQFEVLRAAIPQGAQFKALKSVSFGNQFNVKIYNTNNLRVLCAFPSRGASVVGGGNNAWGNPKGRGINWKANTTAASSTNSFDVKNLNTDLKEQVWRGADGIKANITLDCDTELDQGIFLDTFAMYSNLSRSATVRLIGSNVSNFLSIGFDEQLGGTGINDDEIVYIAPDVPAKSFRYWRLEISDPTNAASYLEAGTIVFGESIIFHQECFVDRVKLKKTNFVDSVVTAGFTTVQNDRGIKKSVKLDFKNLDYQKTNYQKMLNIFDDARTVLKCLWVPTPDLPKRFLIFGKLVKLPEETHNVKAVDKDYVDFSIEIDEAR